MQIRFAEQIFVLKKIFFIETNTFFQESILIETNTYRMCIGVDFLILQIN